MPYSFSDYQDLMRDAGAFDCDEEDEDQEREPRFLDAYPMPTEAERAAYEAERAAYMARLEADALLPEDEPF